MIRRFANSLLEKRGLPTETTKYLDVDYIEDNNIFVTRTEKQRKKSFFKVKKSQSDEENSKGEQQQR